MHEGVFRRSGLPTHKNGKKAFKALILRKNLQKRQKKCIKRNFYQKTGKNSRFFCVKMVSRETFAQKRRTIC